MYINTFAIHLDAQCLSQTIQNLIKNKASRGEGWRGTGKSNLDHKGPTHVTRNICTPTANKQPNFETSNPTPKRTRIAYFLIKNIAYMTLIITKNQNMLWLLMACTYKSQHNFFVKDIYVKTILPIYLVLHLEIFPMKNDIFIWKIKMARKIDRLKKF